MLVSDRAPRLQAALIRDLDLTFSPQPDQQRGEPIRPSYRGRKRSTLLATDQFRISHPSCGSPLSLVVLVIVVLLAV